MMIYQFDYVRSVNFTSIAHELLDIVSKLTVAGIAGIKTDGPQTSHRLILLDH